ALEEMPAPRQARDVEAASLRAGCVPTQPNAAEGAHGAPAPRRCRRGRSPRRAPGRRSAASCPARPEMRIRYAIDPRDNRLTHIGLAVDELEPREGLPTSERIARELTSARTNLVERRHASTTTAPLVSVRPRPRRPG